MVASAMNEKIGIGPTELRGIPLFRGFSDEDLRRLAELFEPMDSHEGALLFAQGEAAGSFYLLIAGEVSLRQDEREVYLLKPPCLIGELGATTGILRHCRAVVGPATILRRIDSARLHGFCTKNPDIGLPFYRALLASAAEKIAHDQRRGAEMREHIRGLHRLVPAGRLGTESEVAAAIVFLLSPAAGFISGSCLRVDGAVPNVKAGRALARRGQTAAFDGFHLAAAPKVLGD